MILRVVSSFLEKKYTINLRAKKKRSKFRMFRLVSFVWCGEHKQENERCTKVR